MEQSRFKNKKGVALIEILIAVTIGGILIIAATTLIASTLRISAQNKFFQAASFLSQELVEKIDIYAEKDWLCDDVTPPTIDCGIYQLNKGIANKYYITASAPFKAFKDDNGESVTLNNVGYTRYFYVENVSRDSSGEIHKPEDYDPSKEDISTQMVTVVTNWIGGGEVKLIKYVTRNKNNIFVQTDWSGGSGQLGPYPVEPKVKVFDTHNNIKFDNVGSIELTAS